MLTEKLCIFMRIYKQFDPIFSLIFYYSFIFGLLRISIGLSVFGFVANKYQWRAIWLLLTIHYIWSDIWWAIPKVILNYSRLPKSNLRDRICSNSLSFQLMMKGSNILECLFLASLSNHYTTITQLHIGPIRNIPFTLWRKFH
jgi:hypothetical protein